MTMYEHQRVLVTMGFSPELAHLIAEEEDDNDSWRTGEFYVLKDNGFEEEEL